MTPERFHALTARYSTLKIAVVGDFCLDRYLEIDPTLTETSIETGRPVHNVVNVRAQPGGAGTIVNNLVALGVGTIVPVGFHGDDGEGYELRRGLDAMPGVTLDHFIKTPMRRTFTYCKPLLTGSDEPIELDRLDSKNWTPTPSELDDQLAAALRATATQVDAIIVLEQVDREGTGVATPRVLSVAGEIASGNPDLPMLADSRRGLRGWPSLNLKMNGAELASMLDRAGPLSVEAAQEAVVSLADRTKRSVFVTLSESGIVGGAPGGIVEHVPALPLRGPIDVVGAGDSVTANLATALAVGATLREAILLAVVASSVVIHQLGTTGTASVADQARLLGIRFQGVRDRQ